MKHTLGKRELVRAERRAQRLRLVPTPAPEVERPTTRGDCLQHSAGRPCPFVSCRYHLFLDVRHDGALNVPFGEDAAALETMKDTCALDVAARGAQTLEEVAGLINVTRERVRQLEARALQRLRDYCEDHELEPGDILADAPENEAKQETPMMEAVEVSDERGTSKDKREVAAAMLRAGASYVEVEEAIRKRFGHRFGPGQIAALRKDLQLPPGKPGRRPQNPQAASAPGPVLPTPAQVADDLDQEPPRAYPPPSPSDELRECMLQLLRLMKARRVASITLWDDGRAEVQRMEEIHLLLGAAS